MALTNGKLATAALSVSFLFTAGDASHQIKGRPAQPAAWEQAEKAGNPRLSGIFSGLKRSLARGSFAEVYSEDRLDLVKGMAEFKALLDSDNRFANALVEGAERIADAKGLSVYDNDDRKAIIRDITNFITRNYATIQPVIDAYRDDPGKVLEIFESGDISRIDSIYRHYDNRPAPALAPRLFS